MVVMNRHRMRKGQCEDEEGQGSITNVRFLMLMLIMAMMVVIGDMKMIKFVNFDY